MKPRVLSLLRLAIGLAGTVAGCASSPPPPPSPDESTRRPVNSEATVELQSCQANLTNTRLLLSETSRNAERTGSAMAELAQRCAATPGTSSKPAGAATETAPVARANTVYVVLFQYAKHEIRLSEDELNRLVIVAKGAASIQVRGRTDATRDNAFDSHLAARRAGAVLTLLVNHGVNPSKIRLTYQGQGDPMAPYTDENTRALNRRAEIEIYRTSPQVIVLHTEATS